MDSTENLLLLKDFLDKKSDQYNSPDFIASDPVSIPHRFSKKADIEIAGFLVAVISWGNRKAILKSADKMLGYMGHTPHDFILNFNQTDLDFIQKQTIHRTFSGEDFSFFLKSLRRIYSENSSMENLFLLKENENNFGPAIDRFRSVFLNGESHRSQKHLSSPYKNSSAKRLIMFLRWMVRQDRRGVDFGIWSNLKMEKLSVPLDVHTGNISRKLGLLSRKQNDWRSVEELDKILRVLDSADPAKYDFALFGLGISGDFYQEETAL